MRDQERVYEESIEFGGRQFADSASDRGYDSAIGSTGEYEVSPSPGIYSASPAANSEGGSNQNSSNISGIYSASPEANSPNPNPVGIGDSTSNHNSPPQNYENPNVSAETSSHKRKHSDMELGPNKRLDFSDSSDDENNNGKGGPGGFSGGGPGGPGPSDGPSDGGPGGPGPSDGPASSLKTMVTEEQLGSPIDFVIELEENTCIYEDFYDDMF
uniref:Uncharacterized protein n=1 Tax=Colletotrichum lindemuthianum TaxID=290576 RepID=A0A2D2AJ81_COLLN|nr:hypothetical protein [Colletotrichum lindemuthianum]ATQ37185.1 hypothetical protein [Colletotrichum lindemuthianum]